MHDESDERLKTPSAKNLDVVIESLFKSSAYSEYIERAEHALSQYPIIRAQTIRMCVQHDRIIT